MQHPIPELTEKCSALAYFKGAYLLGWGKLFYYEGLQEISPPPPTPNQFKFIINYYLLFRRNYYNSEEMLNTWQKGAQ